jgi:colanic acid/amylovoran biosynthesis protein
MTAPLRIVISNTVALNGGDAAILLALKDLINEALAGHVALTVFDSHPKTAAELYPDLTFRPLLYDRVTQTPAINRINQRIVRGSLRRASQAINPWRVRIALWLHRKGYPNVAARLLTAAERADLHTYAAADLVISTGGTYLVDYYFLEPRLFDYEVSLALGTPLAFFTQTAGPFHTPSYRERLRTIFNQARLVLLRDEESITYLRDIGVTQTPLVQGGDAVFLLAKLDDLSRARTRTYPLGMRPRVAVSVRRWPHFQRVDTATGMAAYRRAVGAAVIHLVRHHRAQVTFVSTCQGIDTYGTDDSEVAKSIAEALPADVRAEVNVRRDAQHPLDLQARLERFDFVIATRMHMAILALAAGTPVLPIAYEAKTQHLFGKMDLGTWVTDIETIEETVFVDRMDRFIAQLQTLRQQQIDGTEQEVAQARHAARHLTALLHALRSGDASVRSRPEAPAALVNTADSPAVWPAP